MHSTSPATPIAAPKSRPVARLWVEFVALYICLPVLMALFYGDISFFGVLAGVTIGAAALLSITPEFSWREVLRPLRRIDRAVIAGFAAAALLAILSLTLWLVPQRLFWLPRTHPGIWLLIVAVYPFLSALPQEMIFRVLFFRRYGGLFPTTTLAVAANGLVFGLAHLFYMHWVTVALATVGGTIIGWAYAHRRSLLLVWVMHVIGGVSIFTIGLGIYFLHHSIG